MFIDERHQRILDILSKKGRITTVEIEEMFNISPDSARRDLRILEGKRLLKRTHGGAIPLRQVAAGKAPGTTCRDLDEVKENYLAIAKKAISFIENNDVIFIMQSSLGLLMARNLPGDKKIKVVTNSVIIADELRNKDNISVILTGGEMDSKGTFYDGFAVDMINRLRFDKAFITASCISPGFGLSYQKSLSILFWNAVIKSAKKTYGLFPSEKIGFESVVSICPAHRLNALITDADAPDEDVKAFEEMGISIVIA